MNECIEVWWFLFVKGGYKGGGLPFQNLTHTADIAPFNTVCIENSTGTVVKPGSSLCDLTPKVF